MKEHIYTARKSRIFKQSILIWFFVATHIAVNLMIIPTLVQAKQAWAIIFINVLLSPITIPSILLFFRYYTHSVGKKFIITYNTLKFIDEKTGETTELNNSDIEKIILVQNKQMSRLPWLFHEFFSFIDNKQQRIIITSYFMDLSDFWLDALTHKIKSNKLTREERTYPIF